MKGKTDWKILKKLAEISPKSYAAKIRRRNEEALKVLDGLWETKRTSLGTMLPYGCPHCRCDSCEQSCLWKEVYYEEEYACLQIKFGGTYADDVPCVGLGDSTITITNPLNTRQYKTARAFLLAHIEWTNKYEWGKYYKRKRR